ncbi:hypothetical protein [Amycolatopsis tucumanensis]|uniref:hypothetical protein n=1 Tax=Amycolatopsis tucumanensis TaxID=401106 RepID=UPI001F315E3B|nr:hypothetical protein [Amycolatopsis tucumanensis]MCF6423356.1 hypothetical protein [Amycolatopsis tucumanensis]
MLTFMPTPGARVRRKHQHYNVWEYGRVLPYGWIDEVTGEWRHGTLFPVRWEPYGFVSLETTSSVSEVDEPAS